MDTEPAETCRRNQRQSSCHAGGLFDSGERMAQAGLERAHPLSEEKECLELALHSFKNLHSGGFESSIQFCSEQLRVTNAGGLH